MFDLFKDELDSSTFECIEDYNAEVMSIAAELEDELGKTERLLLSHKPEILEDLGVTIEGVDDSEIKED